MTVANTCSQIWVEDELLKLVSVLGCEEIVVTSVCGKENLMKITNCRKGKDADGWIILCYCLNNKEGHSSNSIFSSRNCFLPGALILQTS